MRFISHRDVARAFERAFRIEQLPLAFTEGFSPRPKVSFGLALSVGHESDAEYLDLELARARRPRRARRAASPPRCPRACDVTGAVPLVDRAPALQESVTAVEYRVDDRRRSRPAPRRRRLLEPLRRTRWRADALRSPATRKGQESVDDIRPAIRSIEVAHRRRRRPCSSSPC